MDQLDLNGPNHVNWKIYEPPAPAPQGYYQVQLPDKIEATITAEGLVKTELFPMRLVEPPPGKSNRLASSRISTKIRVSGRMAGTSQASDLLIAAGIAERPETLEDWKDAIERCAGLTAPAFVSWDCYDKATGTALADRYEQFPDDPDQPGEKLPFIENPATGQRVPARARVAFFVQTLR